MIRAANQNSGGARPDIDTDVGTDADVDVALVGGGLVGRPLALALVGAGLRVALIEREHDLQALPDDPLDQRCTALSSGSLRWLERTGLWRPDEMDASPIRRVHVSHRGHFGAVRIDARELGRETGGAPLGATIENRRFIAALEPALAAAAAAGSLSRRRGVTLAGVEPGTHRIVLGLEPHARAGRGSGEGVPDDGRPDDGGPEGSPPERLRARLLIAADGVDSAVRAALDIPVRTRDYAQSAVLGMVALEDEHDATGWERFTDGGPLAMLPRPGRAMSFVECAAPDAARALAALDEAAYLEHLQARFGRRLGRFTALGPRVAVPLRRVEAVRRTAPRTLLLGNAAALLHPVAGQGYNLAMRDVEALVASFAAGDARIDPGAPERLAAFDVRRRGDRLRTVALTDALARTFRGSSAFAGHLRAGGLVGLDLVGPARRAFARRAMGLR